MQITWNIIDKNGSVLLSWESEGDTLPQEGAKVYIHNHLIRSRMVAHSKKYTAIGNLKRQYVVKAAHYQTYFGDMGVDFIRKEMNLDTVEPTNVKSGEAVFNAMMLYLKQNGKAFVGLEKINGESVVLTAQMQAEVILEAVDA